MEIAAEGCQKEGSCGSCSQNRLLDQQQLSGPYAISIWAAGISIRAARTVSTSIPSSPSIGPVNGKS